jgi:hypothetical protein
MNVLYFYDLHLVLAAPFAVSVHSACGAPIIRRLIQSERVEAIHTIMARDHDAASEGEIDQNSK